MVCMKRIKLMEASEFDEVRKRNWQPVLLVGNAVPRCLRGVPTEMVYCVAASGDYIPENVRFNRFVGEREVVGGIDVYRRSPDDPVPLNKDWYAVTKSRGSSTSDCVFLEVRGPFKDAEHWLVETPSRLSGVRSLGRTTG